MAPKAAPSYTVRVNESTSFRYVGTLVDDFGVAVPPTSLSSMTFTLYDEDTGTIIGGYNNLDVLNANGWELSFLLSGNLVWSSAYTNQVIIDDSKETEMHIGILKWTYTDGTDQGVKVLGVRVINIARVP